VTKACADRGWELHVEHTTIGAVMDDVLEDGDTPCSLCARLRRGVLYRLAASVGATKIALGHHLDDFVETLLLNLFFQGKLKAMPARLVSDNKRHIVIRPLVYVTGPSYTQEAACRDWVLLSMRRFEPEAPAHQAAAGGARGRASEIKNSMIKALSNVAPRHLLDTRLNPIEESRQPSVDDWKDL
jgi:tRNA 2-thiocytidine biosynthesis protein TtcA